jgi:hypothetical protein
VQRFAQGMVGDEHLKLPNDVGVASAFEIGPDSLFEADDPQLLEVRALDTRERLGELGQRGTTPQAQGLVKACSRRRRIARRQCRPPFAA